MEKSFDALKNLLIENGATFLIDDSFNFKTIEKKIKCNNCGSHLEDDICGNCLKKSN